MAMKDHVQDLSFFFVWEASGGYDEANSESAMLKKKYLHAIVNSLPPDVKQTLLVCSRSVESSSTSISWIGKYVGVSRDRPSAQRRYLIRNQPAVSSPFGAPSISPIGSLSLSPAGAPSPSPALVPSSSPSPSLHPPAEAPVETSPPPLLNRSPPPVVRPTPRLPRKPPVDVPSAADNGDAHKKKVLIALIALMSVMTIILAALLLYLLKNRKSKVDPRYAPKDDRPLLNLSAGDLSDGII